MSASVIPLRPYAMDRVCDEIERVVWPIDRAYEDEGREFWIRPAEPIEISQRELLYDMPLIPGPGHAVYVVVRVLSPGVRERRVFTARDIGIGWKRISQAECLHCYAWAIETLGTGSVEIEA
jgi:hypothetical protein